MCNYLNILQCFQLPFALIPLIKFSSSKKILREFAIPKWQTIFASFCGLTLTIMNFVVFNIECKHCFAKLYYIILPVSLIYFSFIGLAIFEPTTELVDLTKEELNDHEY